MVSYIISICVVVVGTIALNSSYIRVYNIVDDNNICFGKNKIILEVNYKQFN